jgi:hypothetical protein
MNIAATEGLKLTFASNHKRLGQRGITLGDLKINIGRTEWEIYFKLFYSETTEPFEIKIVWNVFE